MGGQVGGAQPAKSCVAHFHGMHRVVHVIQYTDNIECVLPRVCVVGGLGDAQSFGFSAGNYTTMYTRRFCWNSLPGMIASG